MTPGDIKNIPDLLLDYMDLAHILFGSNVTHDPLWVDAKRSGAAVHRTCRCGCVRPACRRFRAYRGA